MGEHAGVAWELRSTSTHPSGAAEARSLAHGAEKRPRQTCEGIEDHHVASRPSDVLPPHQPKNLHLHAATQTSRGRHDLTVTHHIPMLDEVPREERARRRSEAIALGARQSLVTTLAAAAGVGGAHLLLSFSPRYRAIPAVPKRIVAAVLVLGAASLHAQHAYVDLVQNYAQEDARALEALDDERRSARQASPTRK